MDQQGGNRPIANIAGEIKDMFTTYFNTIGFVPWQYAAVERGNY